MSKYGIDMRSFLLGSCAGLSLAWLIVALAWLYVSKRYGL